MSDFLLWASVSGPTRDRYRTALRDFRDWLVTSDQPFNPNNSRSIDTALTEFAHHLYLCNPSRGNRQIIINARCALNIIYPITVHQLNGTDRALRGWNRLRPATSKAPVSYGFSLLLANTLLARGEVEAGLFCIVAFDTFCRANELLKLVRDDVTLPAGEMPGGLRLRDTKTGRNQSVTLRHPLAVAALRLLMERAVEPNAPLFNISYAKLLAVLKQTQLKMGVPPNRIITPHCFRHGGASFWFTKSMPMQDIITRGRWVSDKSAKTYIQAGAALIFGSHLPAKLQELSIRLASRPMVVLEAFPAHERATLGPLPQPYSAC